MQEELVVRSHCRAKAWRYGQSVKIVSSCYREREHQTGGKRHEKTDQEVKKEASNVSRTKARIMEFALCNDWENFVTLTLSTEWDRKNLDGFYKKFAKWVSNEARRTGKKIEYLLIPEMHKDGSWHMHGLMRGISESDIVINVHGFLDWPRYREKFGWVSLGKIKDRERVARYITKYVTKDTQNTVKTYGGHAYYHSRGLQQKELIKSGYLARDTAFQWKNDYVFIKWVTGQDADNDLEQIR